MFTDKDFLVLLIFLLILLLILTNLTLINIEGYLRNGLTIRNCISNQD